MSTMSESAQLESQDDKSGIETNVRLSSFNVSFNRDEPGEILNQLSTLGLEQPSNIAEIIQRTNPDIIHLTEVDYIADNPLGPITAFQENYLNVSQNDANPVSYPYVYIAPSNTGIPSGFDLDRNGVVVTEPGAEGYGNDAIGFGNFPGQFAMVLLSKYPIVTDEVRTFQNFLWKDMPNSLVNFNVPGTDEPWYSDEALEVLALSSKSHWDVPINVNGNIVHVLASHPTPPVFDGEEDRNGRRNFDEIRLWNDYITPGQGDYIYDDAGNFGGLPEGMSFVITGDQNSDPFDGDSRPGAANQLLDNPRVIGSSTDEAITPKSEGGVIASELQGEANLTHIGNPAFDTADFNPANPGNLRVDYVLPSNNFDYVDGGVFWPTQDNPLFDIVGEFDPELDPKFFPGGSVSSDHRLVFADTSFDAEGIKFLGQATFPPDTIIDNTLLGGLSSITYDSGKDIYYSLSDDPSQFAPTRFYTLTMDLSDGRLNEGDVNFLGTTTVLNSDGQPYPENGVDLEGLYYYPEQDNLFFTSEGIVNPSLGSAGIINPFVKQISLTGSELAELSVSDKFFPEFEDTNGNGQVDSEDQQNQGVRSNKGFEALTISLDQTTLVTAAENSLVQDGEVSDLSSGGTARIVTYDLPSFNPKEEFLYPVEPILEPSNPADDFKVNGIVALLPQDENTYFALERSFSVGGVNGQGTGFTIRLYEIDLEGATDISGLDSIEDASITPVNKRLLLDFDSLEIPIDNVEGMTYGPVLPNGQQSLVMVADNDFNDSRPTQFLLFGLDTEMFSTELSDF